MKNYYAMMVDLTGHRCLIAGGGTVGERKAVSLLTSGAEVILVSPAATPKLTSLAVEKKIVWHQRPYHEEDGENCFLVIAATNRKNINLRVYHDATRRGQWINVVDQPHLCNFTVPSMVRRGRLNIAISTSGASPALAKKMRQDLIVQYGEEYELYLDLLQEMRQYIQEHVPEKQKRAQLMREMVSEDWIDLCRTHPNEVYNYLKQWLDERMKKDRLGGATL